MKEKKNQLFRIASVLLQPQILLFPVWGFPILVYEIIPFEKKMPFWYLILNLRVLTNLFSAKGKQLRHSGQFCSQLQRADNEHCPYWSHTISLLFLRQSSRCASGRNRSLCSEAVFMLGSANQRWQSSFVPNVLYKMGNENQSKSHFLVHILQEENQYKQNRVTFIYKTLENTLP